MKTQNIAQEKEELKPASGPREAGGRRWVLGLSVWTGGGTRYSADEL